MTFPRLLALLLMIATLGVAQAGAPDCARPYTLALHDHGLLYSADTDSGIDKDVSDELIRRSGCKVTVSLMPRARIWQLIESGALELSNVDLTNEMSTLIIAQRAFQANARIITTSDELLQEVVNLKR